MSKTIGATLEHPRPEVCGECEPKAILLSPGELGTNWIQRSSCTVCGDDLARSSFEEFYSSKHQAAADSERCCSGTRESTHHMRVELCCSGRDTASGVAACLLMVLVLRAGPDATDLVCSI